MPVLTEARPLLSGPHTDSVPPSDIWENHTARSLTRWGSSGAVVSVAGELDASNADQLADHVQHCAGYCEWLVIDLNALEFIGTTGFSALKTITSRCAAADVYCVLVSGVAVARLLRICDPAGELPITTSAADALAGVQTHRPVG